MITLALVLLQAQPQAAEMAGYLIVPHERVEAKYNAGYSMYVAAWPLLKNYPGQQFQSGLFGTWMFAQFEGEAPKNHYSDVEGGLGWWRDTRFATETPKFIMGGVTLNFDEWANGPGAGKGRDWANPTGLYGIAQLSPWILWPPDGLNLRQGTMGELFGYGYLPLPLTTAKKSTAGKPVPTGNNCWTLFLNTANFKGPVAFFTPHFWSKASTVHPDKAGLFLDSRPSEPNKAIQMETQHVPAMVARDASGTLYARIAPTHFPSQGSPLIHRVSAYSKSALWDSVQRWFAGGPMTKSAIDPANSAIHNFKGDGWATWRIYPPGVKREEAKPVNWKSYAQPTTLDPHTYAYRWEGGLVARPTEKGPSLVTLPEYYRLDGDEWVVVNEKEVPSESGLAGVTFPRQRTVNPEPYVTPDGLETAWKKPGPKAGPFKASLGDGSTVTYYWYRFADQPALLNADLSPAEREALQRRAELLHRNWKKNGEYLPPPKVGQLAQIDPALLVVPPKGLEVGYVPIATRQEKK